MATPDDDAVDRRDHLVRAAAHAASTRLAQATSADAAFAATAELLFWIVAADASMLRHGRPGWRAYRELEDADRMALMQGLRHPRNVVAHETEAWEPPAEDVYLDTHTDMYGAWVWADLPPPGPNAKEWMRRQHASYQSRLAGRPVITTTQEALDVLDEFWTRPRKL